MQRHEDQGYVTAKEKPRHMMEAETSRQRAYDIETRGGTADLGGAKYLTADVLILQFS